MNEVEQFEQQKREMIAALGQDADLQRHAHEFMRRTGKYNYTYHFNWLGRPVIQFPEDLVAVQELIWSIRPRYVVETGVAHGGSLIFHASILELVGGDGEVIGIDIDIRAHNRASIESHPLAKRIHLIQGSSTDPETARRVRERVKGGPVMVILDSNHTHDHVLQELRLYAPLVGTGSYLVVFDTPIELMPEGHYSGKNWGKGNNPLTAVYAYLKETDRFEIDKSIHQKLLISSGYDGYLKCVKG